MLTFLAKGTGYTEEDLLEAARAEFNRMIENEEIRKIETSFGTLYVFARPVLERPSDA
jgi:hypothetical protein